MVSKIKDKFKSEFTRNNLIYLLISFVVAFSLWLYVVNEANPEIDVTVRNIPVVFTGESDVLTDRNLTITDGKNQTVSVTFTCKRSDMSKLSADTITAVVDLTDVNAAGTYQRQYTLTYPSNVTASNIKVSDRNPYVVTVTVDKLVSKTIDVRGVFEGSVADGYVLDTFEFNPETVTISGPDELISNVSYAQVTIERENLEKTVTVSTDYDLIDYNGNVVNDASINCSVDQIATTLPVLLTKEIPLTVSLIDG